MQKRALGCLILAWAGLALSGRPAWAGPSAQLKLEAWILSCSSTQEGLVAQAVKRAGALLSPCGISLSLSKTAGLEAAPDWCALPKDEARRLPLLQAMSAAPRRHNPRGLSLLLLPSDPSAPRWSFALVDHSKGAGCGSPQESRFLSRFGALFMTDFAFAAGDAELQGLLLAHEIAHALTQRRHPTMAPRGTLLADHFADIGPKVLKEDCDCMRLSPYLSPPRPGARP